MYMYMYKLYKDAHMYIYTHDIVHVHVYMCTMLLTEVRCSLQ